MITLYNTLTRAKEEFKPLTEGKLNMYVCGPTVYDVPHIGHARSALVFDVIRRYFEYAGYDVHMVRNVTDVDDKIINKASSELQELGEMITTTNLRERTRDVAERYLDVYHKQTAPVLPYYKDKGLVRAINGMDDIGTVSEKIDDLLN